MRVINGMFPCSSSFFSLINVSVLPTCSLFVIALVVCLLSCIVPLEYISIELLWRRYIYDIRWLISSLPTWNNSEKPAGSANILLPPQRLDQQTEDIHHQPVILPRLQATAPTPLAPKVDVQGLLWFRFLPSCQQFGRKICRGLYLGTTTYSALSFRKSLPQACHTYPQKKP